MKLVILSSFHKEHGSYGIRSDGFRGIFTEKDYTISGIKYCFDRYITLPGMLTELKEFNETVHT